MAERQVVVVGGGLAGISAALRAADHGCVGDAARGPPAPGRRRLLVPPRRRCRSTTASTCSCAAAGPTAGCSTASASPTAPCCRPASTSRCCAAGGRTGPPAPHARRARARSPVGGAGHATGCSARSTGCGRSAARRPCACSTRPTPPSTRSTLGAFLRRHGQNDAVIEALWGIVATATLNLPPDDASLALAAKVFRTGLLDHAPAADVGYAAAPLGELHSTAARRALEAAGVDVLVQHRVEAVERRARCVRARGRSATREWRPDAVVLAVPPRELFRIAPAARRQPGRRRAGAGHRADRQRPRRLRPAGHRAPVRRRGRLAGAVVLRPHRHVGTARHPARRAVPRRHRVGRRRDPRHAEQGAGRAVRRRAWRPCCPTRGAPRVARRVRHPRAARHLPAGAGHRARCGPAARPGVDGLWLAGAWTATGWPDTMESAVRSGSRCHRGRARRRRARHQ